MAEWTVIGDEPGAGQSEGGWTVVGETPSRARRGGGSAPQRTGVGSSPENPVPRGQAVPVGQYGEGPDGSIQFRTANGWRLVRRANGQGANVRPPGPRTAPAPQGSALAYTQQGLQGTQDSVTGQAGAVGGMVNPANVFGDALSFAADTTDNIANLFNAATRPGGASPPASPSLPSVGPVRSSQGAAVAARRTGIDLPEARTAGERLAYFAGSAAPGLALPGGATATGALALGGGTLGGWGAGEWARSQGFSPENVQLAATVGSIAAPGAMLFSGRAANAFAPRPVDLPTARAQALASLPENLRTLPPEAMARLDADLRAGTRPQDAAVRAVNSTMRQPIPMSRGQVSGLPEQQAVENSYRAGASGRAPAEIAQAQARDAQAAIGQNLEALGQEATGRPIPARGAGAAVTSETLNSMYDNQRQATTNAYAAARNAPPTAAMFPPAERVMLEANLRTALRDFRENRVPSVFNEINAIRDMENVTPGDLFDMRSALTNIRRSGDGTESAAAATAVRALDAEIARIEPNMTGDPAAVDLWRTAIRERRQQGDTFESNDRIADLTSREYRSGEPSQAVASEDAGNRIFGLGNSWMNKADLARDLARMRRVLGQDSEAWNALRGEHFRRLMDAGRGPLEAGADTFSGRNFANAWRDARRNANGALRVLYTEEQIAALDRLAFLADRTTSPVQGGRNTSATATTTKALTREAIRRVLGGIPFAGPVLDAILTLPDAANARGSFVNPRPNQGAPRLDRPRGAPLTRRDALALTGPGLIGAGNRQGE